MLFTVERSVLGGADRVVLIVAELFAVFESAQPLGTVTTEVAFAVPAVVGVVLKVIVAVAPEFSATFARVAVLPEPLAVPQLPVPDTAQVQVVVAKFAGKVAVQPAPLVMFVPVFDIVIVIVVAEPVV